MNKLKLSRVLISLLFILIPAAVSAQQKVVVIPMIGNGPELKPLAPADVVDVRFPFTTSSNWVRIFTVTDDYIYVLKSILVSPEQYPATRRPISIRFCRTSTGSNCSHSWKVPNDNVTKLDFGLGEIFDFNSSYYLDITDRGGLPENVANQIVVQVSAYRVRR